MPKSSFVDFKAIKAAITMELLLQHYGLRRVNTRGRGSAHKKMLLSAIAFNLKKLLKHQPHRQASLAVALPKPAVEQQILPFWLQHHRR